MLQGNNPANDPDRKPIKSRSTFKPNRSIYQTLLFGLNQPHFAMDAVEGDKISVRVASDLDTQSLKAPVMSPVRMHKDYFFVPTRAILPRNAELLITNPLSGDDIVPENVNCVVPTERIQYAITNLVNYWNACVDYMNANSAAASDSALQAIRVLYMAARYMNLFCSTGSLLNYCGYGTYNVFGPTLADDHVLSYDEAFDLLCSWFSSNVKSFYVTTYDVTFSSTGTAQYVAGNQIKVVPNLRSEDITGQRWNLRRLIEEIQQGTALYSASQFVMRSTASAGFTVSDGDPDGASQVPVKLSISTPSIAGRYVNLSRLIAYQLACASFYTDDAVDYIYSANLWHQNMQGIYPRAYSNAAVDATEHYVLNGQVRLYDAVSGALISNILGKVASSNAFPPTGSTSGATSTSLVPGTQDYARIPSLFVGAYLINIFGFTRSLKYRDYFAGAKPRPMAVGTTTVQVSGGSFDVVDVTKNIQIQRFLNQVNRVGRKFNEYVAGIFGTKPMTDPHECIFLGHTTDIIGAEETENTAEAQLTMSQTVTSKLRKNSSQFAFEGSFSEPGVLIGITNFDVVRPYVNSVDRSFYHVDRFDMFNPFLQQIGDQAVYGTELDNLNTELQDFAYQLRYSEYKQCVDRAVGGFIRYLPGYAFLNNRASYNRAGMQTNQISPDFIRSHSSEFDRFFIALTGFSPAGYFHFIVRQDITCTAVRPMEAAPSIL